MTSQIRLATPADLPRLMRYAEAFLAYHPLTAASPRDLEAVEGVLRMLMEGGDGVLLVHDHGVIGGVVTPLWCSPQVRIASEMFWWATRDGISLMRAFEAWSHERGAAVVQMLLIHGRRHEALMRRYVREGYSAVETAVMKAA